MVNRIMRNLFISLLSFWALAASAQTAKELEVWKNVEALNTAIFLNKDSVALENLLGTKVTYGHSGANIEDKAEMIRKAVNNLTTYREVNTKKISINIIKNTAIVRHQLDAIQKDKDGVESGLHLGVLQVWIKEKKIWKLAARQSVKINIS